MSFTPENETRRFPMGALERWRGTVLLKAVLRLIRNTTASGRSTIAGWIERRAQRRALANLDDRLLNDIGKTRAEANAEAKKPFWRH